MTEIDRGPINIHGLPGCETHLGKRCTACCFALTFNSRKNNGEKIANEAGEMCPEQDVSSPIHGCRDYNNRPRECHVYHCSQDIQTLQDPFENPAKRQIAANRINLELSCTTLTEETTVELAETQRNTLGTLINYRKQLDT